MSTLSPVPGSDAPMATYPNPIPMSRVGECVPLVTFPTTVSSFRMSLPCRGTPLSRSRNPTSVLLRPLLLICCRASRPMKSPVSHDTNRSSPASSGVTAESMSEPCSSRPASSLSTSRAPSPHGAAPASASRSHTSGAFSPGRDIRSRPRRCTPSCPARPARRTPASPRP